jgi:hypothetical protein
MPRVCTICGHSERQAIERAVVRCQPFRAIARRYGVSKDALLRHHDDGHLAAKLIRSERARELVQADALMGEVVALRDRVEGLLDKAEADGKVGEATGAARELRACLELLAKLGGRISDAPQVNITISAEWVAMRTVIVEALAAHPEARLAVVAALEQVTADAGRT